MSNLLYQSGLTIWTWCYMYHYFGQPAALLVGFLTAWLWILVEVASSTRFFVMYSVLYKGLVLGGLWYFYGLHSSLIAFQYILASFLGSALTILLSKETEDNE